VGLVAERYADSAEAGRLLGQGGGEQGDAVVLGLGRRPGPSTQVAAMPAAPISGITAIGRPSRGTTRNQGRVGLAQNWLQKPEK
jgi:hypothetical protein